MWADITDSYQGDFRSMGWCQRDITHWSYVFLALTHRDVGVRSTHLIHWWIAPNVAKESVPHMEQLTDLQNCLRMVSSQQRISIVALTELHCWWNSYCISAVEIIKKINHPNLKMLLVSESTARKPNLCSSVDATTENRELSWCQFCHHWWHLRFLLW